MKKQVIIIHGGDSFDTYEQFLDSLKNWEVTLESFFPKKGWKSNLQSELGDEYEVLTPRMPNKQNAKYEEWKIWFERMFPFTRDNAALVGHSSGGLFLAKYLSKNIFPKKISGLFLVAAPHSKTEDIGDFALTQTLEKVWEQCQNIHLYQSQDDPVVPASEVEEYKKAWPDAKLHIFENRGHFNQESFPELVAEIKGL
ncbi:MAG: alpha/beta hydrolase [Candidatus Moranbacteria bacterium]|nr:alpha/beta hydrolase [Candidatus Moranbacteria bacterium]